MVIAVRYLAALLFSLVLAGTGFSAPLWVAVHYHETLLRSENGTLWTPINVPEVHAARLEGVISTPSGIYAFGSHQPAATRQALVLHSLDGQTWRSLPCPGNEVLALAAGRDLLVGLTPTHLVYARTDAPFALGAATPHPTASGAVAVGDTEAGFRFLVQGNFGTKLESGGSWSNLTGDGENWQLQAPLENAHTCLNGVHYLLGHFIRLTVPAAVLQISHDGESWKDLPMPGGVVHQFLQDGSRGMALGFSEGQSAAWDSTDLFTWQRLPKNTPQLSWFHGAQALQSSDFGCRYTADGQHWQPARATVDLPYTRPRMPRFTAIAYRPE